MCCCQLATLLTLPLKISGPTNTFITCAFCFRISMSRTYEFLLDVTGNTSQKTSLVLGAYFYRYVFCLDG